LKGEGYAIEIIRFCLSHDLVSAGAQVGYLGVKKKMPFPILTQNAGTVQQYNNNLK